MHIVQIRECGGKFKCKLAFIVKVSEACNTTMQQSRLVPELKVKFATRTYPHPYGKFLNKTCFSDMMHFLMKHVYVLWKGLKTNQMTCTKPPEFRDLTWIVEEVMDQRSH